MERGAPCCEKSREVTEVWASVDGYYFLANRLQRAGPRNELTLKH